VILAQSGEENPCAATAPSFRKSLTPPDRPDVLTQARMAGTVRPGTVIDLNLTANERARGYWGRVERTTAGTPGDKIRRLNHGRKVPLLPQTATGQE